MILLAQDFFSREYVVSTYRVNNLKTTLGLGWGKFVGENSFENPLTSISDGFAIRYQQFQTF